MKSHAAGVLFRGQPGRREMTSKGKKKDFLGVTLVPQLRPSDEADCFIEVLSTARIEKVLSFFFFKLLVLQV